jgi:hypothetical protein
MRPISQPVYAARSVYPLDPRRAMRQDSVGREPVFGCAIVRGVDHLVVDVPGHVALGWPARPDLPALLVDPVHEHWDPDLSEEGVDLGRRREHAPTAASWRGG